MLSIMEQLSGALDQISESYKETRQQNLVAAAAAYDIPEEFLDIVSGGFETVQY